MPTRKRSVKAPHRPADPLDEYDLKLVELLQERSNLREMSYGAIASALKSATRKKITPRRCSQKIARLVRLGIVSRFQAVIDVEKLVRAAHRKNANWDLEDSVYFAFAEAEVADDRHEPFQHFIAGLDEVVGCWRHAGDGFDFMLHFMCASQEAYDTTTHDLRQRFGAKFVTRPIFRPAVKPFCGYPISSLKVRAATA